MPELLTTADTTENATTQALVHTAFAASASARVDAFVQSRPEAVLTHRPVWARILSDGLGHRPYWIEAKRDGRTVGVLPLAHVKSFLFGSFLVSLPYVNTSGVLVEDEEAAASLLDEAAALADRLNVDHLQLRSTKRLEHPRLTVASESKVLMTRPLPADSETLWKDLKAEVRNQVRKAEKSSPTIAWGGVELLADFHDVFSRNMRDLGTPVFGKSLFRAILEGLGDRAEFCVAKIGGELAAAALLLHGDGVTEVPSASSLRRFNSTCINMFMYRNLLDRSIERGQKVFDFGRSSPDGGTFRFKKQWGASPQPSVWQYYVRRGDVGDVRPDNPKMQRKIELWKRLPLWLTRLAGPAIIRGVP